jgi:hypothetical protein
MATEEQEDADGKPVYRSLSMAIATATAPTLAVLAHKIVPARKPKVDPTPPPKG